MAEAPNDLKPGYKDAFATHPTANNVAVRIPPSLIYAQILQHFAFPTCTQ